MTHAPSRRQSWMLVLFAAAALVAGWTLETDAGEYPAAPSRENVEEIVRDYLNRHPEVVFEAFQKMQARQREVGEQRTRETIAARGDDLLKDLTSPVGGNPHGDVTVVEFFDYRCPYCQRVAGTVKKLLQEDPNIRFVYKEFPILGEESLRAAKAAWAAQPSTNCARICAL